MNANYREPKKRMPKSWDRLPEYEKKVINDICIEAINKQIDHEEAQLQKIWLQLACIVLHRTKDPWGRLRCMTFLKGWKKIYRDFSQYTTDEDREAFLKSETDKIFGEGGYPHEWVDSLENGGRR
jgi:hypothetical protein